MPTGNPTLNPRFFSSAAAESPRTSVMTVRGTAIKALLLMVIMSAVATVTWMKVFPTGMTPDEDGIVRVDQTPMLLALAGGGIGGFVISLIICFAPKSAPFLAPVYAVCEGALLGAISGVYTMQSYPGIVPQALMMTIGTLAVMLVLWMTGIIVMSNRLRSIIIGATCAIALVYVVVMALNCFGVNMSFFYGSGPIGIGISIFVVIVAALNLLLDFETIENGAKYGSPKYMEWFAAYGLLVTLIWLYLEILRLLAKLNSNRSSDR